MGIAAILLLSLILWPADLSGQTQNILEQAKKEGEVILYTTMTVRDFEIFNKAAKVMQEHRAGRVQADVLGNSLTAMLHYKEQGVLGKYESPEAKKMITGSVDPEGYWAGMTTESFIVN